MVMSVIVLNTGGSLQPHRPAESRSGTIGRPPCERVDASIVHARSEGARMKDRWTDADARAAVDRWGEHGEALALRVHTSRLIGADADLVLHGGGNTSVKDAVADVLGEHVPALLVKGSGW